MLTYFSCCVLSFLCLYISNLSDLVGIALTVLTVTIRNKKETNVESSFSTAPARSDFHPEITV